MRMNAPLIRPLVSADETEWRRLWKDYLAFYQTEVGGEVYTCTFDRLLQGNADNGNEFRGLIAEIDGKPCGIVHFLFHRHCWRIENVCYLQDLYVVPEIRGGGVGRALIEAVYKAADDAECPSVYWMTQDFNTNARRLYDRIGKVTPFIKYNRA